MTLICTHYGGSVGFLAVSDILLNAEGDAPVPTALPLRPRPVFHKHMGRSLAGTTQKSINIGRTLVSWSGSKFIAEKIIRYIAGELGRGDREITRLEVAQNAGVPIEEARRIYLIYHYIRPNGDIIVWHWQCSQKRVGNTNTIFAGSGGPVHTSGVVQVPSSEREEDDVTAILVRSIEHLVSEATSNDTLDQYFGGWIELTVRRGEQFCKVKYAVKLWHLRNRKKEVSSGPLLFNYYRDNYLIIAKFNFAISDNEKQCDLFEIEDVFGCKAPAPDAPDVDFSPMSIFHVVVDVESGEVDVFMTAGDNLGYELVIDKELNVQEDIEPRFWEIITCRAESVGTWSIC